VAKKRVNSQRIDKLRRRMETANLDGLLVTDETNVRYLTGFTGDSTALLLTDTDFCLLSDRRYEQQLGDECAGIDAEIRGPDKRPYEWFAICIERRGLQRVGLEDHSISWSALNYFKDRLPDTHWEPTSGLVAGLRCIKDEDEIVIIRKAIRCAERAFGVLRASLNTAMSELDAAYLIESAIRSFGGSGVGFNSIVAVGPAGSLPHYQPGNTFVAEGQGLLVDWGAKVDGYTSDMTRTLSIGTVSRKMREIYPIVLDAHLAAMAVVRPGAKLCDVDAAAREVIQKAGYGEAFGHGLGHGIGLNVHESPRMASVETGELVEGMVITIEPGIYLPGEIGVRIEDDFLVTSDGCETLCSLPKGLEENQVFL
jgi:Xaa-Pro aminopeptidase